MKNLSVFRGAFKYIVLCLCYCFRSKSWFRSQCSDSLNFLQTIACCSSDALDHNCMKVVYYLSVYKPVSYCRPRKQMAVVLITS